MRAMQRAYDEGQGAPARERRKAGRRKSENSNAHTPVPQRVSDIAGKQEVRGKGRVGGARVCTLTMVCQPETMNRQRV